MEEVLEEWKTAQDVLKQFDDYLHDIRKYGFSFVTGLLTVDALLGTADSSFKLAALVGTMALIVVLYVVDRNYRVFLAAANLRATLLERRSSPELSQTITRVYEGQRVGPAFNGVYIGLDTATVVVGLLVVSGSQLLGDLAVAYIVSLVLLGLFTKLLKMRPWVYFEIDGFTYKKKTPILVTVANFTEKRITLEKDRQVWATYAEEDTGMTYPLRYETPKENIEIGPHSDHRWQIDTSGDDFQAGIYRMVYKGHILKDVSKGPFRMYKDLKEGDPDWKPKEIWDRAPRFRITD